MLHPAVDRDSPQTHGVLTALGEFTFHAILADHGQCALRTGCATRQNRVAASVSRQVRHPSLRNGQSDFVRKLVKTWKGRTPGKLEPVPPIMNIDTIAPLYYIVGLLQYLILITSSMWRYNTHSFLLQHLNTECVFYIVYHLSIAPLSSIFICMRDNKT